MDNNAAPADQQRDRIGYVIAVGNTQAAAKGIADRYIHETKDSGG